MLILTFVVKMCSCLENKTKRGWDWALYTLHKQALGTKNSKQKSSLLKGAIICIKSRYQINALPEKCSKQQRTENDKIQPKKVHLTK